MSEQRQLDRLERKVDHLTLLVEKLLAGADNDTAALATLTERLRASGEALKKATDANQ